MLCQSIIDQEQRRRSNTPSVPAPPDAQSLRATLDRLIAGRELAKTVLTEAACRRHEGKGRVLLVGPSPSCAIFLARAVAFALVAPFAAGDWQGLAKAGPGNRIFDLPGTADFDIESARQGEVFLGGMESPEGQDAVQRLTAFLELLAAAAGTRIITASLHGPSSLGSEFLGLDYRSKTASGN